MKSLFCQVRYLSSFFLCDFCLLFFLERIKGRGGGKERRGFLVFLVAYILLIFYQCVAFSRYQILIGGYS